MSSFGGIIDITASARWDYKHHLTLAGHPRPICWRCGELRPLRCVENDGWLCKPCRDALGQTTHEKGDDAK